MCEADLHFPAAVQQDDVVRHILPSAGDAVVVAGRFAQFAARGDQLFLQGFHRFDLLLYYFAVLP